MKKAQPRKKTAELNFYNDPRLKLWLIPEIYGWLIVALGFGFFVMMLVGAFAGLMVFGLSFDLLFSLFQLVGGVTIGAGIIAFGVALRGIVAVQATLCVIFLLAIIWFLYFFWATGYLEYTLYSSLIGLAVMFPLALCVFLNRERLMSKYEPPRSEIDAPSYQFQSKMDPEIYEEIEGLAEEGEQVFDGGNYRQALEIYQAAFQKIPAPVEDHDAAVWLQTALGDCYFSMEMYRESAAAFSKALSFSQPEPNPFILLRLGQSFFEIDELKKAADALTRAYMLEGSEIFENEDPKYFEFLKTQIRPPENGQW